MTTNEITAAIRRKVLEQGTEIISDATLLFHVNQAYQDVRRKVFSNKDITSTTVNFTAGSVALPATFGTMYGDGIDASNNLFPEVPIEDFYRRTLARMVTIEGGNLKVYPTETPSLTIRFWPKAETLTAGTTPAMDEYFHESILYGGLWRTFEELQDEELSTYYRERFQTDLNERLAAQSAYEETNQRGAVLFTHQNLIPESGNLWPNSF